MAQEKIEHHEIAHIYDDRVATQKDMKILSLELEKKILHLKIELELKLAMMESSLLKKLGTLIVACSGILFGLLSYFHK